MWLFVLSVSVGCAPGVGPLRDGGLDAAPDASLDASGDGPHDGGTSSDAGVDSGFVAPCGGGCAAGQQCVTEVGGARMFCAGPACGTSSFDGGACPPGASCEDVTYDPCPLPAPGAAQCNIASVTYLACVAAADD